jgi:hypothetical protein
MKTDEETWSAFQRVSIKDNELVADLIFYKGDFKNVDPKTDWRLKEVVGKRKELKFLGLCQPEFPIKYPLKLTDSEGSIVLIKKPITNEKV